ncbi:MAG: hypothetical protein FWD36_09240 [Treponema sp.]|nr:hypothetical protein [Treponema sp.]
MSVIDVLAQIGIPPPVGVILLTAFLVIMAKLIIRVGKPADGIKTVPGAAASTAASSQANMVTAQTGSSAASTPAQADAHIIAAISAAINEYRKQK